MQLPQPLDVFHQHAHSAAENVQCWHYLVQRRCQDLFDIAPGWFCFWFVCLFFFCFVFFFASTFAKSNQPCSDPHVIFLSLIVSCYVWGTSFSSPALVTLNWCLQKFMYYNVVCCWRLFNFIFSDFLIKPRHFHRYCRSACRNVAVAELSNGQSKKKSYT